MSRIEVYSEKEGKNIVVDVVEKKETLVAATWINSGWANSGGW
ncbi:hypothetical protein [Zhenpiania hominis]